jgi:hypothetical protein
VSSSVSDGEDSAFAYAWFLELVVGSALRLGVYCAGISVCNRFLRDE